MYLLLFLRQLKGRIIDSIEDQPEHSPLDDRYWFILGYVVTIMNLSITPLLHRLMFVKLRERDHWETLHEKHHTEYLEANRRIKSLEKRMESVYLLGLSVGVFS
jgi:hypothetical protein